MRPVHPTRTIQNGCGDTSIVTRRLAQGLPGEDVAGPRIEVYDGTVVRRTNATTTISIRSPDFFHRVVAGRGIELAFQPVPCCGDVEVDGDIFGAMRLRDRLGSRGGAALGISVLRDASSQEVCAAVVDKRVSC